MVDKLLGSVVHMIKVLSLLLKGKTSQDTYGSILIHTSYYNWSLHAGTISNLVLMENYIMLQGKISLTWGSIYMTLHCKL